MLAQTLALFVTELNDGLTASGSSAVGAEHACLKKYRPRSRQFLGSSDMASLSSHSHHSPHARPTISGKSSATFIDHRVVPVSALPWFVQPKLHHRLALRLPLIQIGTLKDLVPIEAELCAPTSYYHERDPVAK